MSDTISDGDTLVLYYILFSTVAGCIIIPGVIMMMHAVLFSLVRRYRGRWARYYAWHAVYLRVFKEFDTLYKSTIDTEEERIMEQPTWTFMFPCVAAAHVILPEAGAGEEEKKKKKI